MTAGKLLVPPFALTLGLLLAAACGGDGGGGEPVLGRLTDPRTVPTATPKAQPPEPIILDPNALTPISQDGGAEEEDGGGDGDGDVLDSVQVTPVTPFQVTSDESTNRRTGPSIESAIAGTLVAGEKATVTGQVQGEEVEEGNDIWYQLDDGTFVYSGAVRNVEE